eukprot:3764749-Ditylum_brightwellii.AAC.1
MGVEILEFFGIQTIFVGTVVGILDKVNLLELMFLLDVLVTAIMLHCGNLIVPLMGFMVTMPM